MRQVISRMLVSQTKISMSGRPSKGEMSAALSKPRYEEPKKILRSM